MTNHSLFVMMLFLPGDVKKVLRNSLSAKYLMSCVMLTTRPATGGTRWKPSTLHTHTQLLYSHTEWASTADQNTTLITVNDSRIEKPL